MKLHRLELVGIGPFRARQVIDFDLVGAQGLFLIDGPTGAGKTTIIDAIVYALYGRVSASDSDDARMRSDFVEDHEPSSIVCEFSVDGHRLRIERTLAFTRPPRRGSGKPVAVAEQRVLTQFDAAGGPELELAKERDISEHLQRTLGLDADQFRKLVVLPQGEFAALLRMAPTDRGRVLEPLLGDGLFRQIQEQLEAEGQRARAARVDADKGVLEAVHRLSGALDAYRDWDGFPSDAHLHEADASDDERVAVADAAVTWMQEQVEFTRRAREQETEVLEQAQARADAATNALASRRAVDQAHDAVAQAQAESADDDRHLPLDGVRSTIARIDRTIGEMAEFLRWEHGEEERRVVRTGLAAELDRAAVERTQCADELVQLPIEIDRAERELLELRDRAGHVGGLELQAQAVRQRLERFEQLEQWRIELEGLGAALTAAQSTVASVLTGAQAATAALDQVIGRQRDERAAMLAALLAEGAPCPVCGSCEHPAPAPIGDVEQLVGDEQVDAARRALGEANTRLEQARATEQDLRREHDVMQSRVDELLGQLRGVDAADQAQSALALEEQLRAARDAGDRIEATQAAVAGLRQRLADADQRLRDAEQAVTTADLTLRQFDRDDDAMRERVRAALGDDALPSQFVAAAEQRLGALRRLEAAFDQVRIAEAALSVEVRGMDLHVLTAHRDESRQHLAQSSERHAAITERLGQLTGAALAVGPLRDELVSAVESKREQHRLTSLAIDLGDIAAGGRGNLRKLPLRAYALQLRFRSVLEAASRHLERMSDGKFSFELKESSRQGYSGLGIWIIDTWSGALREPKTLSGGETFYASLSLALGLAEVVQAEAGGRMLETLFVDEGFGSLDADTLDKVLDQLDRLRSGGRVVGVVSHVSEMKEAIADRVDVRVQSDRTSAITMVC